MTAMAISMSPDWLDSYTEQPVDPTRPIVDPHHHLWPPGLPLTYGVDELVADTGSGHNIVKTVFVECGAGYSHRDPDPMAPVGETRFVAAAAADCSTGTPTGRRSPASSPPPTCDRYRSTTCSTPTSTLVPVSFAASATPCRRRSPPRS
jgi:hypothetical protein